MNLKIRPFTEEERQYAYRQSMQIQSQTGSIGYLKGDFGKNGKKFFSKWQDHVKQWKTDAFQAEFDNVINALRLEECGLLQNRSAMMKYAGQYPESGFEGTFYQEYGFRIDTENHAYLLRCNAAQGDDNFYCFCYVSEFLDEHMEKARQGIRFITSRYKELFCIPDGGKIVITNDYRENREEVCRFIDEYHTEVGDHLYHICQFAEIMEKNGSSYQPKEAELDREAATKDIGENQNRSETLKLSTAFGRTDYVQLDVNYYQTNKSLYVGLTTREEGVPEPYGVVTVNLSEEVPPYCAYVDVNNMPELENFLRENRIAEFIGLEKQSGFCTYPLYLFYPERLRELCPEGMERYEKENGWEHDQEEKKEEMQEEKPEEKQEERASGKAR